MVQTSLNLFDLGVFAILGLSAMLSFFRGLIREVLSLGAWVGAALITLYAFPHVAVAMQPHVKSTMIASGFAALGCFMLALIIISVFNGMLMRYVKPGSEIGLLDNALGLGFGLLRGVLLVSLAYFVMTVVMPPKDYPEWVKTAKTRLYVEKSAKWIAAMAPSYLDDLSPLKEKGKKSLKDFGDDEDTGALDKAIREGGKTDEDAEPSTRWQSMEELQKRMNSVNKE